jgi:hypothetical protein
MISEPTTCPECFATIANIDGASHAYLPTPAGCWSLFNEVLVKEYSQREYWQAHRLTVDAYCAQHASGDDRRQIQSVAIHLAALYLNFEKHYSNERIAQSMDLLIKRHKNKFPMLSTPSFAGTLNITSLLAAASPEQHHSLSLNWAQSVWQAWRHEHETIAKLAAL